MGCGGSKPQAAVDISKKKRISRSSPVRPLGTAGLLQHTLHSPGHAHQVPEKLSTLLPQSGPLPTSNYWSRLSLSDATQEVVLDRANYKLRYAYTSLRGMWPRLAPACCRLCQCLESSGLPQASTLTR